MNIGQLQAIAKETGKILVLDLSRPPKTDEMIMGAVIAVNGRVVKNRNGRNGGTLQEVTKDLKDKGVRYTVISIV